MVQNQSAFDLAYSANVIGDDEAGDFYPFRSAGTLLDRMLDDYVGDEAAHQGWLTLIYLEPAGGGPEVLVLDRDASDNIVSGRVTGRVARSLVQAWSGGTSDTPPLRPGLYLLPPTLASLLVRVDRDDGRSVGQRLSRNARVRSLLCETLDAWSAGALVASDAGSGLDRAERDRLANARRLIEQRYSEKLTIDRIARACGMGRARLIRGFRLLYGRTVADMLADHRLSHAAAALRSTDEPVSRIAHASGYCSNAAFTRAFARQYGTPPSVFRAGS